MIYQLIVEIITICIVLSDCNSSNEVVFTNVTFDQHQIHSSVTPCADFYFRAISLQPFDTVEHIPQKGAVMEDTQSSQNNTSIFSDLEKALDVGLTFIVLWRVCTLFTLEQFVVCT